MIKEFIRKNILGYCRDLGKLSITVGGFYFFHGHRVKIDWIDHVYVMISFIDLGDEIKLALRKPCDGSPSGTYSWVEDIEFKQLEEGLYS